MAKKKFTSPFVLFSVTVSPEPSDPIPGLASAHGHLGDGADNSTVGPMNYDAWLNTASAELDGNKEAIDWGDYRQWFVNNNLDTNQMDPLVNPKG